MKKMLSLLLAGAFFLNAAAFSPSDWTWGEIVTLQETTVAPDAVYRKIEVSSPIGPQSINALEFDPKSEFLSLRAGMSHGSVNGSQTVPGMAADFNEKGEGQVVAGINGDYFTMGIGVPFGIFMDKGEVLSTPPQYSTAFGIKTDGTPFCVSHGTIMNKVLVVDGEKTLLSGINNRHSTADSIMVYNEKFGSSTKSSTDSVEVLCKILDGEFKHGDTVSLMYVELYAEGGDTEIPEGHVVLSAKGSYRDKLLALHPFSELSVFVEFVDFWQDVEFAIAGNYLLLKDGEVQDVAGTERSPRTVIGIKEDGTVVFYTIDGRMSNFSVGATYKQAATIMRDLGCVDAINLDGGGSTTFALRPLGAMDAKMINVSADKAARAVANGILLVNTAPQSEPKTLVAKLENDKMLLGGIYKAELVGGYDENYLSYEITDTPTWSVDEEYGRIDSDGTFTALGAGKAELTVRAGKISGSVTAQVVDSVDEIVAPDSLVIRADSTKSIDVSLLHGGDEIAFSNDLLAWSVEGDIGEFTSPGEFTAASLKAEGAITVTYGETVKTIAVSIDGPEPAPPEKPIKPLPFVDMESHAWAKDYLSILYNADIVRGTSDTTFSPERNIKRADFILMLLRLMEIQPDTVISDQFEDVPVGSYYYNELATAKRLGIARGTSDTAFAPERSITREEMFTLTWRVLELTSQVDLSSLDSFNDKALIAPYAVDALATLVSNSLVTGDNAGNLNPKNGATRAEAAVFLARVYNYINPEVTEDEVTEDAPVIPSSEPTI